MNELLIDQNFCGIYFEQQGAVVFQVEGNFKNKKAETHGMIPYDVTSESGCYEFIICSYFPTFTTTTIIVLYHNYCY